MKLSKINKPRILLIGAGNFGKHHFNSLKQLEEKNKIDFVGVFVRSKESKIIQNNPEVDFYFNLSDDLLKSVDAVDVVTPPSTHFELTKKCLNFTNVFLEKPITLSFEEGEKLNKIAKDKNRILFLGHIYRFHPSVNKLKLIIEESKNRPKVIECIFEDNPKKVTPDCGVLYSDLHGFDIIDYLFKEDPIKIFSYGKKIREDSKFEDEVTTELEYKSGLKGIVKLSWNKSPKIRTIKVIFLDKIVFVDLILQKIFIEKNDYKYEVKSEIFEMPLDIELNNFIKVLKENKIKYPDAFVALRILNISINADKSLKKSKSIKYIKI